MTNLFCTPEQGAKLKELLPKLTSEFVWASLYDDKWFITEQRSITYGAFVEFRATFTPALTLQELRDLAKERDLYKRFRLMGAERLQTWREACQESTAPQLADWIIERLEAKQ